MDKIKLALCDDIKYLCDYFESVFKKDGRFEFVGMAHNSKQCLALIQKTRPDILLLDIQMEKNDSGVELIPKLLAEHPALKIIILTIHEEDEYILRAFTFGASDYILKTAPIEKVVSSVIAVHNNTSSLRPEIAQLILAECSRVRQAHSSMLYLLSMVSKLSNSEFEVLKELYDGKSYKELSKTRFVEEITIRTQVNRIVKKFGAANIKSLVEDLKKMQAFDIFKKQ